MWNSRNRMLTENDGDDVAFLSTSGDSRHGLYGVSGKRDLYGYRVAQCSKVQAIAITIFIFTAIFLTALAAAFVRPFHVCEPDDLLLVHEEEESPSPIATNGEEFPWDDVRLPRFIVPVRYDIELTPNLTTLWVRGIQKLIFTVTEETSFIVFHSKNISIQSRTINERLKVQRMLEYPLREQIYLETDDYMRPGITYAIRIKFQYRLTQQLAGFYLSTYRDKNHVVRRLATTHFEPTYARQAFPCFDEPQLKAKFLMTITHDRNLKAFFNTPKREVSYVRGKSDQIRDEFEETVHMSTYLIAFVVCDFEIVSEMSHSRINVSVIAAPNKMNQTSFALEAATRIMDYYHDFFGVPYPLPKQDLIAIPDFGAGAMENWGLITFRETSLLYSEEETSVDVKQQIAVLLAHELGHQWFGNLVTMKWWNDLWLNEGFASWLEYQGVDHISPDWRMEDQFFFNMIAPALSLDSLSTSHPVSVPVHDPKEIEAIFDAISYKKGAAIIHMLEDFVGRESLRKGLTKYLNDNKFGNAVTNDLWNAVTEAWTEDKNNQKDLHEEDEENENGRGKIEFYSTSFSKDVNVQEMMDTWTLQTGYPLITFEPKSNNSNIYSIKQSRFLKALALNDSVFMTEDPSLDFDFQWVVPITYQSNIYPDAVKLVLNKTHNIEIEFPADITWFKANVNGTGFYRVNYPLENWKALVDLLRSDHKILSSSDRAQLINDAFCLSEAGLLSATIPLDVTSYLIKEDEIVPWAMALKHLEKWKSILRDSDLISDLNQFILKLILPMYEKLGWKDRGSHADKLIRKLILMTALNVEYGDAEEKAKKAFEDYRYSNRSVHPNLRTIVYKAGVKFGKTPDWDFAWEKYNNTQVSSERSLWMRSLADTSSAYLLQRYLTATLDRTKVRSQDVRTVLGSVANNPAGTYLAWRHVQIHFPQLQKMFGRASFTMGGIIQSTVSHFSTQFDYDSVYNFFKKKNVGSGKRALAQSLERIRVNIEWRRREEGNIAKWIRTSHIM